MLFPRVAIIGAGPAGLTLARLLQQKSIECIVFEKDLDEFARTRGGSLDLHEESGQGALREAGLYDEFLKHARRESETLRIFSPNGKALLDESAGEGGRPEEFNNRPEIDRRLLRKLLLESLITGTVKWNSALLSIDELESGKLNLRFADRIEHGFDVVVGADGAWSKVRPSLTEQQPFYSGIGGLECHITAAETRRPALAKRVGKGMCLTLGENKGIMCQTNGDGGIQVYAFARLPESWYAESSINLTKPEARSQIVERLYADWEPQAKQLVLESDMETFGRPLYMLPVGFKWPHNPRITLIGDAAHLMTPFAGVGVNVAMDDALELSHTLSAVKDQKAIGEALQNYEVVMWKRAEQAAEATMGYLGLFFHERGGIAMVEHFDQQKKAEAEAKAVSNGVNRAELP